MVFTLKKKYLHLISWNQLSFFMDGIILFEPFGINAAIVL